MYKKLYFLLFNAITDALAAQDGELAKAILMRAQQEAEEIYISKGD